MPLDLLGALNEAASENGLGFNAVCNVIAGTDGLDGVGALNVANSTTGLELNGVIKALTPKVTRTNLIQNPSFETNTTGWQALGTGTTVARITTDAFSGSACLQVTKGAVANAGATLNSTSRPSVTAGKTYTFSAYVKVPTGGESGGFRVSLVWQDGAGSSLSTVGGPVRTVMEADGWVRVTLTAVAPTSAAYVLVRVLQPSAGTAGEKFLLDSVLMESGRVAGTYFDGASTNGSWSSTANGSSSTVLSLNFSAS